jgi:hypothetical protein
LAPQSGETFKTRLSSSIRKTALTCVKKKQKLNELARLEILFLGKVFSGYLSVILLHSQVPD